MNESALRALLMNLPALDPAVAARTQALLDGKTKPRR